MDVLCERCHTRYEFDEALVSARGTTVKCTQCGHLFKVHPPSGTARVESWTVQTLKGDRYVYRAMRELQAAITQRRVTREDVMIPSVGAPRRLGDIEELDSFFPDLVGGDPETTRQHRRPVSTRIGVQAPVVAPSPRRAPIDRDGQPLPTRTGTTLRPPAAAPAQAPAPSAVLGSLPRAQISPVSLAGPALVAELAKAAHGSGGPLRSGDDDAARGRAPQADEAPTHVARSLLDEADDGPTDHDERRRDRIPAAAPSSSIGEAVDAMQQAVEAALVGGGRLPPAARSLPDASAAPTLRRAVGAHGFEEADFDITDDGHREPERRADARSVQISEAPPTIQPPSDPERPSLAPLTPTPSVARPSVLGRLSRFGDPRFSSGGQAARQPSFARWTIGLVLLGVATVVAFTLVKRYLPASEPAPSASPHDARIDKFLRAGQDRLAAGDLEGAREQFVMASGVTDADPRVLQALADVEVVRADQAWLKVALLRDDDPARGAAVQELSGATKRAAEATDRAAALAPKDRASVRLRISVLRLGGDRDGARGLVAQLRDPSPADALVLAALDLGEKDPSWPSVLDRLQTAARSEQRLGRARAMLVYALARAGQKDAAGKELELLASYAPPHPLVEPLRLFVDRSTASSTTSEDGGTAEPGSSAERSASDADIPTDFREALRRAHAARAEGKLDRAEAMYRAALDRSPGNSEALEGVAEVARARGNSSAAITAYETLLRGNPAYLPAMAALADLKWQTGSRAEALALYRQLVEAAPGSSYAKHAQSRLETSAGSSAPATTTSPAATGTAASAPTATAAPTGDLPPGVDVSDLPGLR
jgi:predicted Zn finger-like uncharacterized protein